MAAKTLTLSVLETGIDSISSKPMAKRATDTCADPTLARTIFQGFSGESTAHVMTFRFGFVNSDSMHGPGPAFWTLQGPVFKGWPMQLPFTVPLFRMATPTANDFVFMVGPDALTPPVLSGFSASAVDIIAWVYDTPVCDSVPLMSAVLASQTDHYYTTDADEHAGLLASGWADSGVVAFVLPMTIF